MILDGWKFIWMQGNINTFRDVAYFQCPVMWMNTMCRPGTDMLDMSETYSANRTI